MSDEDRIARVARALHINLPFIRSIPKGTQWIAGTTLLAWIFKAVILDAIPEILPRASALGGVVDGLFSAIIAGYIFYILFALWPDYQARSRLAPFIFGRSRNIVGDCMHELNEIGHACGFELALKNVQPEEITNAFSRVKTSHSPRMINSQSGLPVTWMEYFGYQQERSKNAIAEMFEQGRFLDAELTAILTEIDGCAFFNQVRATFGMRINNTDLSAWGPGFARYLASCRKLAEWHDVHRPSSIPPLLPEH